MKENTAQEAPRLDLLTELARIISPVYNRKQGKYMQSEAFVDVANPE